MAINNLSRRDFLASSAAMLAGIHTLPLQACSKENNPVEPVGTPLLLKSGRIIINNNVQATSGTSVNESIIQKMIDDSIMQLTGITTSPAAAFETLFPNLSTSTKIALKPNFLNNIVPTRKEVAKAIVNRLTQMLNGTFPAGNIYFYERHSFSQSTVGYTTNYFGKSVHFILDTSFPDLGHYIYCDGRNRPYSKTLHDCDYLINMPVLKDHGWAGNFTLSFKNHLGTVNPGGAMGICSNVNAALDIMASSVIKSKQVLIVLDGIFGVHDGGPSGNINCVPNTILMSQDPVTIDYHGREIINSFRKKNSLSAKKGDYIERASSSPYNCGISDPAKMEIIRIDNNSVTSIYNNGIKHPDSFSLKQNYPNPFNAETEIEFEMKKDSHVNISIYDVQGRFIDELVNDFRSAQKHRIRWNANEFSSGIYFCKMKVGDENLVRTLNLLK